MANWLDYYLNKTANKVKNSALYNALTGNKDEEITFTPLQKIEGADSAGNIPAANNTSSSVETLTSAPHVGEVAQSAVGGSNPQIDNVQLDIPEEDKLVTQKYIENEQKAARENPTAGMTKWDRIMYNMGYKNQPAKGSNLSLYERLVGQQAKPTDSTSQTSDGTLNMTVSENPRTGGLLRDIGQGFRENKDNGFSIDNLGQNETADGRQKGLAYKIGEGLGSLARIAESPLGRGLITAGLVGATGGSGLEALAYGGQAGVLNQQNRMRDKLYRNDLIENYAQNLQNDPRYNQLSEEEKFAIKNQKYGEEDFTKLSKEEQEKVLNNLYNSRILEKQQTALDNYRNQIVNTRGYLTDDSYKNMMNAMQLRDNAAYRKMYYDDQKEYRKEQTAYQKERAKVDDAKDQRNYNLQLQKMQQDAAQHNAELGFKYSQLQAEKDLKNMQMQAKQNKSGGVQSSRLAQIDTLENLLNDENNAKHVGLQFSAPGVIVNRLDPDGVMLRSTIDNLKTDVRHDLTGAAFGAQERAEYDRFLPNTTDTPKIILEKLKGLKNKLNADSSRIYGTNNSKVNAMSKTGSKYKITRVK